MPYLHSKFALLVILFLRCDVTLSAVLVRSGYGSQSNYLEQYHHYRNLTSTYPAAFFDDIKCYQVDQAELRQCLFEKMRQARTKNLYPPIWNSITSDTITDGNKRVEQQVDCSYSVPVARVSTVVQYNSISVTFQIKQEGCVSKTDILGGSSFHIEANNEYFTASCGVVDLFDGTYSVDCRLPLDAPSLIDGAISGDNSFPTKSKVVGGNSTIFDSHNSTDVDAREHRYCLKINILLEFEHFDAFGREGGLPKHAAPMLFHRVLRDHTVCTAVGANQKTTHTNSSPTMDVGSGSLKGLPSENPFYRYIRGIWMRNISSSDVHKHRWTAADDSIMNQDKLDLFFIAQYVEGRRATMSLSKEGYSQCQSRQTNIILGESHQRFTWNFLAYHFHEGQALYLNTLGRKHGDVAFYHLEFVQKFLISNFVRYLDNLVCPTAGWNITNNIAIALQMGSWDLTASPLRNVLDSKQHGVPALLESIKKMQLRGCSTTVKLVLVQTMPYPICSKTDDLCTTQQVWHNTYATAALSEYIKRKLTEPEYFYGNLEIVDSTGIISASLNQYECINHFLCRHGDKQNYRLASTPAGEALSSEIIGALCDKR